MKRDFERWTKYRDNYIRAFDRMLEVRKEKGLKTNWKTGEEVMDWWVNGGHNEKVAEGQTNIMLMSDN